MIANPKILHSCNSNKPWKWYSREHNNLLSSLSNSLLLENSEPLFKTSKSKQAVQPIVSPYFWPLMVFRETHITRIHQFEARLMIVSWYPALATQWDTKWASIGAFQQSRLNSSRPVMKKVDGSFWGISEHYCLVVLGERNKEAAKIRSVMRGYLMASTAKLPEHYWMYVLGQDGMIYPSKLILRPFNMVHTG